MLLVETDSTYCYGTTQILLYPLYAMSNCFALMVQWDKSIGRLHFWTWVVYDWQLSWCAERPKVLVLSPTWSYCTVWYVAVTLSSLKLLIEGGFLKALGEEYHLPDEIAWAPLIEPLVPARFGTGTCTPKFSDPDQIPTEVLRGYNAGFACLLCCITSQISSSHPLLVSQATILYPSDGSARTQCHISSKELFCMLFQVVFVYQTP